MNPTASSAPPSDATTSARYSAIEAFAYTGLEARDVQAAVIAGGVTLELLLAVAQTLPEPRPILLLDTLESLTELERRAEAGAIGAEVAQRCTTVVLAGPAAPYCVQTYSAIWELMLAHGLDPKAIALCGTGQTSPDDLLKSAYLTAADLLLCHSSQFLVRVNRDSLQASQVIQWALHLGRVGSAFHALKLLYALSHAVPRASLAPTIIDLWAELGCPEPALDWLDALEPEQRQQCEGPLRQVATARREVLGETLEQNRAALARYSIELPAPVGGARSVHLVLLPDVPWLPAQGFGARRNRYPCLFRIEGGQIVELAPLGHPRALFQSLRKPRRAHDAVALLGRLASPTLFQLLAELQPNTGLPDWKQKVYIVEEDPDVVQAFASTLSVEHPLSEERFDFLLGPGTAERLERRMLGNPLLPLPEMVVDARRELVDALVRVRDHREARIQALVPAIETRYTPERLTELPRLLGPAAPRPARILIYTSFFTTVLKYQARDMAAAFEGLGHPVRLVHEGEATQLMTTQVLLEAVADFDPDLIYCIDLIRPGLKGMPPRLPVVCWIQDELPRLARRDWISTLGPLDFTFCLSAEWTQRYRDLGYPHTAHLSMAADPEIYAPPGPESASATSPRVPAVVMITHVPRPTEAIPGLFAHVEPILRAQGKMRATILEYEPEIRAVAAAQGLQLDVARLDEARQNVHLLARHVELTTAARWLVAAGVDVGLYGSGWKDLPDLAPYALGAVRSGRELSAVYSSAKLVLHINGTTNRHVRVFECLAAGGLPLCRSHRDDRDPGELNDALEIGKEVLVYDDRQDLLAKVQLLLGDEALRQKIVRAGRERVLSEHCMKHRMQLTLDEIRRELDNRAVESQLRPRLGLGAEPREDVAASGL